MKKISTIGLVAPSGVIKNLDDINSKIEILKKSFKVKKFYNENSSNFYLSDSDENRIKYFEEAFLDSEVDLVLSVRGGYGAIRIVDDINYELIKNSNKKYIASSDATILLASLTSKTNIKCYHGLMLANGFLNNLEQNIKIIENDIFDFSLFDFKTLNEGIIEGELFGGNLSSFVSMLSSDTYLPSHDIVLFLEDLNEPLYKIDKMLYEIYRYKPLKKKLKGIIFGDFYIEEEKILPLLKEFAQKFSIPAKYSSKITHKADNITIPFGKYVKL